MNTPLPTFASFLANWQGFGSPKYMDSKDGNYCGAPVFCANHARISMEGLPESVLSCVSDAMKKEGYIVVGPAWTRNHGIVLDVSNYGYSQGWCLAGVGTYLPDEQKWVHPSEVHSYGYQN